VLELVAFCAKPRPFTLALDEMPRRIAALFQADVCSIYLVEGEDLVMRDNVGFPREALGDVRLAVGEGITGLAVEYMRPMSLDAAPSHASFRDFPVLGEDRYPIFLAIPIPGATGPLGALVLQKRAKPSFSETDLELASALCAPIAAMVDRAKLVDRLAGKAAPKKTPHRRVTLSGRPLLPGRAVGVLHPLPRLASTPGPLVKEDALRGLSRALTQAQRSLEVFARRARETGSVPPPIFTTVRTMLDDARLKERTAELSAQGLTLAQALGRIGLEAVKAAPHAGGEFAEARAQSFAEVCDALTVLSQEERKMELPRSAVFLGDGFSVFDLLVITRAQPAAIVLSDHARGESLRPLLELLGVPTVIDVAGLFRWAAEGEVALVDGDHGLVRLNPGRLEINAVRSEKAKGRREKGSGPG